MTTRRLTRVLLPIGLASGLLSIGLTGGLILATGESAPLFFLDGRTLNPLVP